MTERLEQLHHTISAARAEVRKIILGQDEVIDRALIVILARQHALLEGVPGVAKTLLARTLAHVLGCPFARIQFTPDLMPADITGTNIFNFERNEFTLVRGPVFTSFLLADEINRAPAKTQSALLQAMQERTVTIDRETHVLPETFTVFATQNPIEYEGTYPLPEAQKDRFLLKVPMAAPDRDQEIELAQRMLTDCAPEAALDRGEVRAVLTEGELARSRAALGDVSMRPEIAAYIVDIARRTRTHESILVGAGPRATQALVLSSRAHAALAGRDFVTPDDVKALAVPVLEHRLILRPEFEIEGMSAGGIGRENSRKRGGAGLMVPSARLIWLVAALGFPASIAAAMWPGARWIAIAVIAVIPILAIIDALLRERSLDGIRVVWPELARFYKDREATVRVRDSESKSRGAACARGHRGAGGNRNTSRRTDDRTAWRCGSGGIFVDLHGASPGPLSLRSVLSRSPVAIGFVDGPPARCDRV